MQLGGTFTQGLFRREEPVQYLIGHFHQLGAGHRLIPAFGQHQGYYVTRVPDIVRAEHGLIRRGSPMGVQSRHIAGGHDPHHPVGSLCFGGL